jgi:glutaredoxin
MRVEVYGTQSCTYCKQAVSLCENKSVECDYIDVGIEVNLKNLTDRLGVRPRTVPQIFVDGRHLSKGYDELRAELADK